MSAFSVKCCPATKRNGSASAGGTTKVIATASRVSRSTFATCRRWKRLMRAAASSVRLEVVEGLEAIEASAMRLACGGTELGQELRSLRRASGACDDDRRAAQRTDARDVDRRC